jgi:hypothetical protein
MSSDGECVRICGFAAFRRCGTQACEQRKVPRVSTPIMTTFGDKLSDTAAIEFTASARLREEMKFANDHVSLGDSFTKVGSWSGTVYVVASFFDPPGMPSHVRLVAEGQPQSAGTLMSVSAVLDRHFWRRVPVVTK